MDLRDVVTWQGTSPHGLCMNPEHPDGPGHPYGPDKAGPLTRWWARRLRKAAWGCDCSAGQQHPGQTVLGDRLLLTTARQAGGSPRIDVGSTTAGELSYRCLVLRSRQPGDGRRLLVPNPEAGPALAIVVGFRGEAAPWWWRRLLTMPSRGLYRWWPPVRLRGPRPEAKLTVEDDGTVHGYLATKRTGSAYEGIELEDSPEAPPIEEGWHVEPAEERAAFHGLKDDQLELIARTYGGTRFGDAAGRVREHRELFPFRAELPGHYEPGTWGADVFNRTDEGGQGYSSPAQQVAMERSLAAKAPGGKLPHEGGPDRGGWHDGRLADCEHDVCRDWMAGNPPPGPALPLHLFEANELGRCARCNRVEDAWPHAEAEDPAPTGGPVSPEELATEQVPPRRVIDRPQA